MTNPFLALISQSTPQGPEDSWVWAVVTRTFPLQIKLDTDATPLDLVPTNLGPPVVEGDRVWVQIHSRRVFIHSSPRTGAYVVSSATRPGSPYQGQIIFEVDTARTLVWAGGQWVILNSRRNPARMSRWWDADYSTVPGWIGTEADPTKVAAANFVPSDHGIVTACAQINYQFSPGTPQHGFLVMQTRYDSFTGPLIDTRKSSFRYEDASYSGASQLTVVSNVPVVASRGVYIEVYGHRAAGGGGVKWTGWALTGDILYTGM